MTICAYILAKGDPVFTGIIIVVAMIFWGFSALAKGAKAAAERQKQRMRQARESIQQDQFARRNVQLAPEIARRVPPPVTQRPSKKKTPKAKRGPATNYNAMVKPPPIPVLEEEKPAIQRRLSDATLPLSLASATKTASTANAMAINRWLNPKTLKQQFILTELFQPPLALRDNRI
jgi:type IV secretory pathway VirB10-like protein